MLQSAVLLLGLYATILLCGCASIRPPASARPPVYRTLTTTGYCPCGLCCGWHRNWLCRPVYSSGPLRGQPKAVGITASGTKAHKGTVAADPERYPFGTVMYVDGYGYARVEDTGGALQGDHIDLFFRSHSQAMEWGVQRKRVAIWFP